jgi:hypothetical protein
MPSEALLRLLQATRPYKEFIVDIDGDPQIYYARRPGSIESARVSKAFDEAYAKSKRESENTDYSSLYTLLKRQDNKRLAEFIVRADEREYLAEASMLNNDAPLTDPQVKKDAAEMAKAKQAEYEAYSHEDLLKKAWERREHFQAMEDGQTAANYMMAVVTLFCKNEDGTYDPLFENIEEARQLPMDVLLKVVSEALKVVGEGNDVNPLKSAPNPSSAEPTSSPDEKAAESPSPTSSGP